MGCVNNEEGNINESSSTQQISKFYMVDSR
jgi:hypothetical protein